MLIEYCRTPYATMSRLWKSYLYAALVDIRGEDMPALMVYEKVVASPLRQTTPRRQIRTVPTY
jgi:hypothetical protein